jgi:hypothetical protein
MVNIITGFILGVVATITVLILGLYFLNEKDTQARF